MDVTRHDSDFASITVSGLNDSGTVRSNESSFVLRSHDRFNSDHIESGDTFSNANDEINFSLNSFEDSSSSKWRRNVNDGSFSSGLLHTVSDIGKDGETHVLTSSFVRVNSTDNLSSVIKRSSSVERSVLTGHTLNKEFSVLVDENSGLSSRGIDTSNSHRHKVVRSGSKFS